ncbi:unnamed protein product, partial [Rotaria socialis]
PVPVWTSSSQVQLGSYTSNKSQGTEKCDYNEEEDNDPNDNVRLWEEGWRERYYKKKFNIKKKHVENFEIEKEIQTLIVP